MIKIANRCFISIYIIIISLPICFSLLKIKVNTNKDEPVGFNYKKSFPFKNNYLSTYKFIKHNIFKTQSLPNSVIETKDNWLFLGNHFSEALSESKGIIVFNEHQLKIIKQNLSKKKEWLDKHNIKFYLSIAPNKHSIYGDKISISKSTKNTKLEQVKKICQSLNINFIDLSLKFKDTNEEVLFYKTDSHWNHLGSYYAFLTTIEAISKDFPSTNFKHLNIKTLKAKKVESQTGDLNNILGIGTKENKYILVPKDSTAKLNRLPNKLKVPINYTHKNSDYENRFYSGTNKLKILGFRDSFFTAYNHLMADNFGKSTFIFWHNFNENLILEEKPDIVYYEIVERNIDILLNEDFNHSKN